jgi:hypothetical protein
MQYSISNHKRNAVFVWQGDEVSGALNPLRMRHTQRFSMGVEAAPFVSDKHGCQERIVCDIQERYNDLPHVGIHDISNEASCALFVSEPRESNGIDDYSHSGAGSMPRMRLGWELRWVVSSAMQRSLS